MTNVFIIMLGWSWTETVQEVAFWNFSSLGSHANEYEKKKKKKKKKKEKKNF